MRLSGLGTVRAFHYQFKRGHDSAAPRFRCASTLQQSVIATWSSEWNGRWMLHMSRYAFTAARYAGEIPAANGADLLA